MALQPNQQLSHFRLIAKIGEGGMGVVWKARDTQLSRDVALKFLPPEILGNDERRRRFLREARTAAAISHPNIATVYEIGEAKDLTFIAMELITGDTLRVLIRRTGLGNQQALSIASQMADGLTHAHGAGVIHRDLKPDNVMIGADGHVRLLDFGLAKIIEEREARSSSKMSQATTISDEMTREGKILGTAAYMSPEQARGIPVDLRSDTFSFGVTLYEMITGQQPFHGATPMDTLTEILDADPSPPSWLNGEVPEELDRIVRKCLQKEPAARYQDTRDLLVDLRQLKRDTESQPIQRLGSGAVRAAARPTRARRAMVASATLLGLTAVALLAWQLWPQRQSAPAQEITETLLTTNSVENPVWNARISRDGRYLAYWDDHGLFMRVLDTGEVKELGSLLGAEEAEPSGWFPDGTRLLVTVVSDSDDNSLWTLSVVTGAAHKLRGDSYGFGVSPDGEQIAFSPGDSGELWLMDASGANARKFVEPEEEGQNVLWWVRWSPDSRRIAYRRQTKTETGYENSIETYDLDGGSRTILLPPQLHLYPGIHGVWLDGGRLLFSQTESKERLRDNNLWLIDVDMTAGEPRSVPQKLTSWVGFYSYDLTATHEGGVAVVRWRTQREVFVATLTEDGSGLQSMDRMTRDVSDDRPTAWTPDGERLLFMSDRRGSADIFSQAPDGVNAQAILASPAEEARAISSPDGQWILYETRPDPFGVASLTSRTLWRMPASGGASEQVMILGPEDGFQCGRGPESRCVLMEAGNDGATFFHLDPLEAKGKQLGRAEELRPWSLSTDGKQLLWGHYGEDGLPRLHFLTLDTGEGREIALERMIGPPTWCIRGDCLYAVASDGNGGALARIGLDGRVELLSEVRDELGRFTSFVVSPDGRRLAFSKSFRESSVWLIENL